MGSLQSNIRKSRKTSSSSYSRKSSDVPVINRKIDEKESVFIAMQSEIDKAITENNRDVMISLLAEIAAHIMDLNQLKQIDLTSANRGRAQKIIYNFELSHAKLKFICNYDTAMKKEKDRRNINPNQNHSSSFCVNNMESVEPDIVTDLIRFDNATSEHRSSLFRDNRNILPHVPENRLDTDHPQLLRSNSLYSNQAQSFDEEFSIIESEFGVLKDQAQRLIRDVNEYYQMDKGVFYLYNKLKNLELPENSLPNERKAKLIKELTDFRIFLDKMSPELEEQRDINQEINTLELLLDSASSKEIAELRERALVLQERTDKCSWDLCHTENKLQLLRRIAIYLERIAYTSPSASLENSGDHLYGNLNILKEELKNLSEKQESESISNNVEEPNSDSDNPLDSKLGDHNIEHGNDEESVYGNVEVITQNLESHISKNIQRTGSSASQRGTIYVNADMVKHSNPTYENHIIPFEDSKMQREVINNLELSQISVRSNENLEKEIFINEAQTLRNVVDAKPALDQQPLVQWPEREIQSDIKDYPKNDVNIEMEKLESKFQKIKNEVSAPNTEEDIHKYYKLAQEIKKWLQKLDGYKFIRGTDLFNRKTDLHTEMQICVEALEKEGKDADYVISIEEEVDTLETILNSNQQSNLKVMAKELQEIQSKLETHKVSAKNETLRERKTSIQQKTGNLVLKLKQMADNEVENKNKQIKEETKKINDIEDKVKALRPGILNFVGLQSDSKFYEFDETSMRLILILDKFETDNLELQKRKIKLLKELQQFGQILDERAEQTHEVSDLEQKLERVSFLINEFSGKENELTKIKEELEKIASKLQGLRVNKELVARKNGCMERLSVLFNKVMPLSVSTQPETSNVQKYHDSSSVETLQTSKYSLVTSSTHTSSIQYNSSGYVSQYNNFVDTNIKEIPSNSHSVVKVNDNELFRLEKEIGALENLIESTSDLEELKNIDEAFTQYTILLNNLKYPKDTAEYVKKLELLEITENLTDVIEKKQVENQTMEKIEHKVDEIGNQMSSTLTDEQINKLDERLRQREVFGKLK